MSGCDVSRATDRSSLSHLGGRGPGWVRLRLLAQENGLKLEHAGDGQEHGRILGHQTRRRETLVALRLVVREEG